MGSGCQYCHPVFIVEVLLFVYMCIQDLLGGHQSCYSRVHFPDCLGATDNLLLGRDSCSLQLRTLVVFKFCQKNDPCWDPTAHTLRGHSNLEHSRELGRLLRSREQTDMMNPTRPLQQRAEGRQNLQASEVRQSDCKQSLRVSRRWHFLLGNINILMRISG